jgi:Flp pilus assembly protein TadD
MRRRASAHLPLEVETTLAIEAGVAAASAEGQIDRALEINPSDAECFLMRGAILLWAGRAAEALSWIEGALRLDSANARKPDSLLLHARRFDILH